MSIRYRVKNFLFLFAKLRFGDIGKKIKFRISSNTRSYGLARDLSVPFATPSAKIPISVRKMEEKDVAKIFDFQNSTMSPEERKELFSRYEHLLADIPTCYIAVTSDDTPAYMQWLMGSNENQKIQGYFNGTFPILSREEALLENAYTLEAFRGKGVMPTAMAEIALKGKDIGAKRVITFVDVNNIPSLKGCAKAGFYPYTIREEKWFLFRRKLSYKTISAETVLYTLIQIFWLPVVWLMNV